MVLNIKKLQFLSLLVLKSILVLESLGGILPFFSKTKFPSSLSCALVQLCRAPMATIWSPKPFRSPVVKPLDCPGMAGCGLSGLLIPKPAMTKLNQKKQATNQQVVFLSANDKKRRLFLRCFFL